MAKANGSNIELRQKKTSTSPLPTVYHFLEKRKSAITNALPSHLTTEKMMSVVMTEFRRSPKLLECSPASLFGAILQASQLGMLPGPLGECYFVPFWNKKQGCLDVQFILGYKGMLSLARRSGQIKSIEARCVYSNDVFKVIYGLHSDLIHEPVVTGERGDLLGSYVTVLFKEGGFQFEYMSLNDINKRRKRSQASSSGPWMTDYEEMCMKTVVRHIFKYLPVATDLQELTTADEKVIHDEDPSMGVDIVDLQPEDYTDGDSQEALAEPSGDEAGAPGLPLSDTNGAV